MQTCLLYQCATLLLPSCPIFPVSLPGSSWFAFWTTHTCTAWVYCCLTTTCTLPPDSLCFLPGSPPYHLPRLILQPSHFLLVPVVGHCLPDLLWILPTMPRRPSSQTTPATHSVFARLVRSCVRFRIFWLPCLACDHIVVPLPLPNTRLPHVTYLSLSMPAPHCLPLWTPYCT